MYFLAGLPVLKAGTVIFASCAKKKMSVNLEKFNKTLLSGYAGICGNILARSHCKTGQGAAISGYIGKTDVFAKAICHFALEYADQTERDFDDFMVAIKTGKLAIKEDVLKAS
jgi:hypothetical protein